MKKVLWSIAAATLIILTGCANTVETTQPEDRLPLPAAESALEPDGSVESKTVALSAGNDQLVDNTTVEGDTEAEATPEPGLQAEPPTVPSSQEPKAPVEDTETEVITGPTPQAEAPTVLPSQDPQTPVDDAEMEIATGPIPQAEPPAVPLLLLQDPQAPVDIVGTEVTTGPVPQTEPSAAPQPQEPQASVRVSVIFVSDSKKETAENPNPAPSETPQVPEPESTPTPVPPAESDQPAESVPPAASEPDEPTEPTFSIDYWINFAQEYAKSVGLNLDSTAVDCWDNPITAGAHCTYLERDIQSRLNRYARDETILDVWIWAESRSDGSYDLYIGYA